MTDQPSHKKKKSALSTFASNGIKQKQQGQRENNSEFLLTEKESKLSGDTNFWKVFRHLGLDLRSVECNSSFHHDPRGNHELVIWEALLIRIEETMLHREKISHHWGTKKGILSASGALLLPLLNSCWYTRCPWTLWLTNIIYVAASLWLSSMWY